jgi:ankyrin repeat protein
MKGCAMISIVFPLWLIAVTASHTPAIEDDKQSDLSIAIVLPKDDSGVSLVDRRKTFQVVFTNRSAKPIRIWGERCQFGHESMTFRFEEDERVTALMHKRAPDASAWKNHPPKTITINPRATFDWIVGPSDFFWGERAWKNVPEPNTGKPMAIRAIFEIKPSDAGKKHGVWTGRITSTAVEALVVDGELKTPHQYLTADCPKQALAMMQADREWVNKTDDYQRTPLHLASEYGFIEVARWLLENGGQVNAKCYNQFTPLYFAREPEMAKLLLEHKADVNAKHVSGTTLQHAASNVALFERYPELAARREKWRTITKLLLDAGAEYDIRSAAYLGDTDRVGALLKDKKQARDKYAMREAAKYGQAKIVKLFLEHGADPEDADYGGLTISYFAMEHADVLKLLFDAGADPKITVTYRGCGRGPEGSTLLHQAAAKGCVDSAKLLLAKGVAVDVMSKGGSTPLEHACWRGHVKMVELLLENKANPKVAGSDGRTPMSIAAREVQPEQDEDNVRFLAVIRALERAGAELDVFAAIACNDANRVGDILKSDPRAALGKDPEGRPALHQSVALDHQDIVKLLLEKGCDPDIRNESEHTGHKGGTALLEAASWGRPRIAEILIARGASVNAKSARGRTPLHVAAGTNQMEIAQLLLKHGANINAKDDDGETPLDCAKAPEMIDLLSKSGGIRNMPNK